MQYTSEMNDGWTEYIIKGVAHVSTFQTILEESGEAL